MKGKGSWTVRSKRTSYVCVESAVSSFSSSWSQTSSAARACARSPALACSMSVREAMLSRVAKICSTAPLTWRGLGEGEG